MATYKGEEINTKPTEAMANNAKRGLEWREEFGRGGTEVGVARARDLINRRDLSINTVRRMYSYLRDTLSINRQKDSVVERKDSPAHDELLGSFGEEMLESLGQTESRKDSIH